MIHLLTIEALADLGSSPQPPCLSLYQPTHRRHPENQQDVIRFRNLLGTLETSLKKLYPAMETRVLLEPFEALARDSAFWNHAQDGLAVLGGSSVFRVFRLQRPVAELAIVADSFHTKPLRRFLQSVDRYQVLGLSLSRMRLFEGNRDALDEIEPAPGVPRSISDLPTGDTSDRGPGAPRPQGRGGKDKTEKEAARFFRAVDRAVLEHHSRPSRLPLILAALPEHHHLFHEMSRNPFLMEAGLPIHPDVLSRGELRDHAWHVVEPQHQARLAALADEFARARARRLGSDDLEEVAREAVAGRVGTLLIEADRQMAGRIDAVSGQVEHADLSHPEVDDLLDDLGELVEKASGRVLVLPAEIMPTAAGLAATYRY